MDLSFFPRDGHLLITQMNILKQWENLLAIMDIYHLFCYLWCSSSLKWALVVFHMSFLAKFFPSSNWFNLILKVKFFNFFLSSSIVHTDYVHFCVALQWPFDIFLQHLSRKHITKLKHGFRYLEPLHFMDSPVWLRN